MGADLARLVILGFGLVMTVLGLSLVGSQNSTGLYPLFTGLVFIVAAVIERMRYRSNEAETTADRPGPGGGEPTGIPLDARFRPTEERFEDPTTGVRMRVWLDPIVGERRYVADE
ncbi:MAG TPA: hypothetical protein VK867_12325 [Candidatus Limnocylindrales bacterium]|nr:hypothetical protein [Candidatus Limnocylindrales bacterium]